MATDRMARRGSVHAAPAAETGERSSGLLASTCMCLRLPRPPVRSRLWRSSMTGTHKVPEHSTCVYEVRTTDSSSPACVLGRGATADDDGGYDDDDAAAAPHAGLFVHALALRCRTC
jgi:hypothetical protein